MIVKELIKARINKFDQHFIIDLQYNESSFNARLNNLEADGIVEDVINFVSSFRQLSNNEKYDLAHEFFNLLFAECEKHAKRSVAKREGSNVLEIVRLNYEYILLLDREYLDSMIEELMAV